MTIWIRAPHSKSRSWQDWWSQALWQWRYDGFSLSHDLTRSQDQRVSKLYGSAPLKVSHHFAKIDGCWHCDIGDIMVLVCQMIPQDHFIKGSCDFLQEPVKVSYHLAKFGSGVMIVLVYHVIPHDHKSKGQVTLCV